jgi:hypothetical protein
MFVYDADGMDSANDVSSAWDLLESPYILYDFDRLEVKATYNPVGSSSSYVYVDRVRIAVMCSSISVWDDEPPPSVSKDCDTVDNPDFETDDTWTRYSPTAVITNSNLTLTDGDVALQNIYGLDQNTDYNAVISVTQVTASPIELNVSLGEVAQVLEISSPGQYTTTLTTPANIVGPHQYALWNQTDEGNILIDFTCLYLASSGPGGEQVTCIAPTNGEFDTSNNWDYYRGATWDQPAGIASLPAADNGLIRSSGTYSLPTLASGEYLLLSFDSASESGEGGGVSARVGNLSSEAIGNFTNYPTWYTFETDISGLAGTTDHRVALVNPGSSLDGANVSDVAVDNVCIFVSDRPMKLPEPVDPDAIAPVDLGFGNIQSCQDIDGIWAGFGVNMAQHRANYAAGFSFWAPTEWLVAAIFVTLADWSCMFMAAFLSLMSSLEYLINNFLNIGNWLIRSWPAFVDWLWLWNEWFGGSLTNLSNSFGAFLAGWADWLGKSLTLTSGVIGVTLAAASDWIGESLANLNEGIAGFLSGWAEWLGNSLANISNWIGASLTAVWDWLATYLFNLNGLKTIINWLIAAWNSLLSAIAGSISDILDYWAGLWNDVLQPFLEDLLAYLSIPFLLAALLTAFYDLFGTIFDFFITSLKWAVENIIQVASSPIDLYNGFFAGLDTPGFTNMFACSENNVFCFILLGVDVINGIFGPMILYPLVIIGIILVTIYIWGKAFQEFLEFVMVTLRDL